MLTLYTYTFASHHSKSYNFIAMNIQYFLLYASADICSK